MIEDNLSHRIAAPNPACRAVVIVPARNEREHILAALSSLSDQVDADRRKLEPRTFEILVLLNNCSDDSAALVRTFQRSHSDLALHAIEQTLDPAVAHVGTARKMLMDAAYTRLQSISPTIRSAGAILSTDADTVVAADWIFRNLRELQIGADAVGGQIEIAPKDLTNLDCGARAAYEKDQLYQKLVAQLESLLDPDPFDPWPRHLQHFGASLACTPKIYAEAGGMRAVRSLEDVAFVDSLRRCDARLRHSPLVRVQTSARLSGRAEVGLSGQLTLWKGEKQRGESQLVETFDWLLHRFKHMGRLRRALTDHSSEVIACYPRAWQQKISESRAQALSRATFLAQLDCDRLIRELFRGNRFGDIDRQLGALSSSLELMPELQLVG